VLRSFLFRLRFRRPALSLLAIAVLAAVTGAVVASLVGRAEAALRRYGPARPVAVATRAIAAGAVIRTDDAEVRSWPAGLVPPGAFSAVPVGRTASAPTFTGEPLVAGRVAPGGLSGVAAVLPAGTRAIAVPLAGAGPPLAVGDTVDLLATFDPVVAGGGEPTVVVSEGAVVVGTTGDGDAVTVAVPAADAPRVAFAVTQGAVTVALGGGP
jgi:Flp pilus assembly protein CpaB